MLSVLVVLEPAAGAVPHPYLQDGRILEPHWTLSAADCAALETALRLRDKARAGLTIQAVAVAPRAAAPVLREALSLGIDRVRLLVPEGDAVTSASAAAALAALLRHGTKFDLILGGSSGSAHEEGLVALLTSEGLGVPWVGTATAVAVRHTDRESEVMLSASAQHRIRALPAAVSIEASLTLRTFTMHGYLAGLSKPIEPERWPRRLTAHPVTFLEGTPTEATAEVPPGLLSPTDAARRVFEELGLSAGPVSHQHAYDGSLEDVTTPDLLDNRVCAVLAADNEGRLAATAGYRLQGCPPAGRPGRRGISCHYGGAERGRSPTTSADGTAGADGAATYFCWWPRLVRAAKYAASCWLNAGRPHERRCVP